MNRAALLFSPALFLAVASAVTSDPNPCPACLEPEAVGLCHLERCRAQVLPIAKRSSIAKDTWSGPYVAPVEPKRSSTEHADKMAAQTAKANDRLGRAMGGAFTVTRHSRKNRMASR